MRQRRKHNLDAHLERCKRFLLPTAPASSQNALIAVQEKAYFDWLKHFPKDLPVSLEIGCGKGSFAVEFSRRNPNKNLVAVERNANIIVSALMAADAAEPQPTNLLFLHSPCEVLPRYFRPGEVQEIFLNFSTPLPKGPYVRQRLTHPRFLALYQEMLAPGGKIYLKTDSQDFFEYSKEQLAESGFAVLRAETDLYKSDLIRDNIQTEYERRFVNMGLPIYEIIAEKKE